MCVSPDHSTLPQEKEKATAVGVAAIGARDEEHVISMVCLARKDGRRDSTLPWIDNKTSIWCSRSLQCSIAVILVRRMIEGLGYIACLAHEMLSSRCPRYMTPTCLVINSNPSDSHSTRPQSARVTRPGIELQLDMIHSPTFSSFPLSRSVSALSSRCTSACSCSFVSHHTLTFLFAPFKILR